MSENYYVLLDLEPSVDDWAVIEAAIKDHRRSWSLAKNQGSPPKRREAERHLLLISDMETKLRDPQQRRAIAEEAQKEVKDQKAQYLSKLDELISVIHATSITPKDLKLLVRQVGGGISESDVVARLAARGKSVGSDDAAKGVPKARPKLDRTIAESIRDNLRHIKKSSLYDFLGIGPRSSAKSLHDAGDEIYKDLRRKGLTDPDSTARQELAGHCKAVFRDASEKERYDNSYAAEAMKEFEGLLEVAARDSFLDQGEIDLIVRKARSKGVSQDVALECIEEKAHERRWSIQRSTALPSADLKLCGFCNVIAKTSKDTLCSGCGRLLVQPCPKCGQATPTQDECCGSCGCSTGDAPVVQGLLREGKEHLARSDFLSAVACFDRALIYWENWQPAIEAKRRVDDARRAQNAALDAVNGMVRTGRLEEAQSLLDRLRREFGDAGTEDAKRRIESGTQRARDTFRVAEALRVAGKSEDAVEKYSEALAYCADYQPAMRALAACPPPSPSDLQVTLGGDTAQLTWKTVRARGTVAYRVQRKASGVPNGPNDGTTVCEVNGPPCHDTELPPGTAWHYSVFALRGGVASTTAASSGPHLRVADPSDVMIEAGDKEVSLRWTRPPKCVAVEVWRETESPPAGPGQGTRVATAGDSAIDQGLLNGATYGYLIVACFTDPRDGHGILRAPGVGLQATPVAPPPAVGDLLARREDRVVMLSWTPPSRGNVQIRQTREVLNVTSGRIISLQNADRFGAPVPISGRGSAQATLEGQGRVLFVPLTVIAQTAVVGTPVAVTTLDEVENLDAGRHGDTIHLTWTWPAGAVEALVAWRHDVFLTEPDGSAEGRRQVTRTEYERSGMWELRNAPRARHYFTVFVRDPDADICSAGAQALEGGGLEATVNYRVITKRTLLRRIIHEAWVDLHTKDVQALPALEVVLKQGLPPIRPEDGRVIASLERLDFVGGIARIDLPVNGTGFVKLFFKDALHAREIRLRPAATDDLRLG